MSEEVKEITEGSFLRVNEEGKAYWGQSEGGGGGGGAQPDLSQTDTTKPDYVKGVIRQESLPEGYPYKGIGTILDGTFEFADSGGIYMRQIADENFTYADGKSYTIIWDGVTYQCVATIFSGLAVLGNLAIAGAGADTGEPFLFADKGNGQKMFGTTDTAATHTITVRGETIYPMDNEYLQNSNIINDLADGSLKTHGAREATGVDSLAEGSYTISSGNSAHAEGSSTTASGNSAHAEGSNTTAKGYHSHAEGNLTIAIGDSSHVEGYETAASGLHSHAEGIGYMQNIRISGEAGATVYTTTDLIDPIIMEGSLMEFNGVVRKILSYNSSEKKFILEKTLNDTAALNSVLAIMVICGIAGGDYSHSEGRGSVAFSESQHVQGKYNIGDSSNKYAHIVGNGSSETSRSNAHTLDWDGNAWFAGDVYVKGTSQNDTAAIKLATLNDLPQGVPSCTTANNGQFLRVIDGIPTWTEFLPTLTSPNGTKYQLAVSDDGTLSAVAQS